MAWGISFGRGVQDIENKKLFIHWSGHQHAGICRSLSADVGQCE
jgi:hypothetical protein